MSEHHTTSHLSGENLHRLRAHFADEPVSSDDEAVQRINTMENEGEQLLYVGYDHADTTDPLNARSITSVSLCLLLAYFPSLVLVRGPNFPLSCSSTNFYSGREVESTVSSR